MTTPGISPLSDRTSALGRPLQAYPPSATQKYNPLISTLIYGILALGFFFIGRPLLLRGAGPFPAFDDPQLAPFGTIFTLALPGLFALLAVVELTRTALNWRKVTVVYERGLAFYDWRGWREWRWEEIEAIRLKVTRHYYQNIIPLGTTRHYTVTDRSGKALPLDRAVTDFQELMDTIERTVNRLISERMLEAYNAGQSVHFGPIQISRDGLVCRRKFYAWAEVEAVTVADGRIAISRKNGGFFSGARVDAAKVPNLAVLLRLLDCLRRKQNVAFSTKKEKV
jgi:hypothetical protein